MNKHLETSRLGIQTITNCRLCGDVNSYSDCATVKEQIASRRWFEAKHQECGEKFKQITVENLQEKVEEILNSKHVASVEVGLDEETDGVRFYSAVTRDKGIPHIYTVRVEDSFESGEKVTTAKCNCLARTVCRHIAKVAKADAERKGRKVYPVEISNYRAYQKVAA